VLEVDVLTILGTGQHMVPQALDALSCQGHVRLSHHRVPGPRLSGESRVAAIARARNRARRYGTAPLAFFLDRDVVLPPRGIERLAFALHLNPGYAALGINYQGPAPRPAPHVAMGAVLFFRTVLVGIEFRSEPGRCECSCCCADLRRAGYAIDYLPGVEAAHLKSLPLVSP
jgi:hypothetical protein